MGKGLGRYVIGLLLATAVVSAALALGGGRAASAAPCRAVDVGGGARAVPAVVQVHVSQAP